MHSNRRKRTKSVAAWFKGAPPEAPLVLPTLFPSHQQIDCAGTFASCCGHKLGCFSRAHVLAFPHHFSSALVHTVLKLARPVNTSCSVHCMQLPGAQPGSGLQQQCVLLFVAAGSKPAMPSRS